MKTWLIASLLAGSGFCALVYQVAWLREFRLIFGASTEDFLRLRRNCYEATNHPLLAAADRDLNDFLATAPRPLVSR